MTAVADTGGASYSANKKAKLSPCSKDQIFNSKHLGSISFDFCGMIDLSRLSCVSKSLKEIAAETARIQMMNKRKVTLKELIIFQRFFKMSLVQVIDQMPHLKCMQLYDAAPTQVQEVAKSKNCHKWDMLLVNQSDSSERAIISLLKRSRALQTITLDACHRLSNRAFKTAIAHCKHLKNLDIISPGRAVMSRENTAFFLKLYHRLNTMALSFSGADIVKYGQTHKKLRLVNCTIPVGELVAIGKSSPELCFLHLVACDFADGSFADVIKHFPQLRSINLTEMQSVNDESLQALCMSCPKLEYICLRDVSVTNLGLETIAKYCQHLTTIYLYKCVNIDGRGLCALAEHCISLKKIEIHQCPVASAAISTAKTLNPSLLIELSITHASPVMTSGD